MKSQETRVKSQESKGEKALIIRLRESNSKPNYRDKKILERMIRREFDETGQITEAKVLIRLSRKLALSEVHIRELTSDLEYKERESII